VWGKSRLLTWLITPVHFYPRSFLGQGRSTGPGPASQARATPLRGASQAAAARPRPWQRYRGRGALLRTRQGCRAGGPPPRRAPHCRWLS
jgi:hypothetical protein